MLLLLGCAATISGKVDGEAVPPLSTGFWYEAEDGGDGSIVAVATDFGGTCAAFSSFYLSWADANEQAVDDLLSFDPDTWENYTESLEDAYEEAFPAEAWVLSLWIGADADDEDDVPDDYDVNDGEATISVTTIDEYPDGEAIVAGFAAMGDTYVASSGEIKVAGFVEEGLLRGRAEADLTEEDGDDAGEVDLQFSLPWCEDAEDAWDDVVDSLPVF